jgi:hypothetical protein
VRNNTQSEPGFFDRVAKSIGLKDDKPAAAPLPSKPTTVAVATPKPRPVAHAAEAKPELKPAVAAKPETKPAEAKPAVASATPMNGGAPIVSGNNFDSRWSAFR